MAELSLATDSSLEVLARSAGNALRRALSARGDGGVLTAQVEDDLRSALGGLEALQSHLEELFRALLEEHPRPLALIEAADDAQAQAALVSLEESLTSLRRRLATAAARLRAGG
jgi:hypothetical protein